MQSCAPSLHRCLCCAAASDRPCPSIRPYLANLFCTSILSAMSSPLAFKTERERSSCTCSYVTSQMKTKLAEPCPSLQLPSANTTTGAPLIVVAMATSRSLDLSLGRPLHLHRWQTRLTPSFLGAAWTSHWSSVSIDLSLLGHIRSLCLPSSRHSLLLLA